MSRMIITICGSTKFRDEILATARVLTLGGQIVLAPFVFGHSGDEVTEVQKAMLDKLHFEKIDMSHAIYVVNPDGYVGESTANEIEYARAQGKAVIWLAVPHD